MTIVMAKKIKLPLEKLLENCNQYIEDASSAALDNNKKTIFK